MAKKVTRVLVAVDDVEEDMCAGDSGFDPSSCGEYVDGMTFEEAVEMFFTYMKDDVWCEKDWTLEEFKEEYGSTPTGFWLIDAKIHDIITNVAVEYGNDSACYAGARVMKTQIDRASERYLRP